MKLLVRKIENQFWKAYVDKYNTDGIVSAYPITNDLKSCNQNTISVWEFDSTDDSALNKILICLALNRDHLQDLDITFIRRDTLEEKGISIAKTPGETDIKEYNHLHRNLENLDIDQLKVIASAMLYSLKNDFDKGKNRYSRNKLANIFAKKISENEIELANIKPEFHKRIINKIEIHDS